MNFRISFTHNRVLTQVGFWFLTFLFVLAGTTTRVRAQEMVSLTLDSAVERAMGNSYRVRQLQLGVEQTRSYLRSRQASLKSSISMDLTTPEFEAVSETKWNSLLGRDEIIRENTRLWLMNFSVRQPVILFGYPTNGYLSLNNRIYRYSQLNGGKDISYYNRYFIKFEQPFFQPNVLKNQIEDAELDLERAELDFLDDVVDMIDDLADDYYDLFEISYSQLISSELVTNLELASEIAQNIITNDTTRRIEAQQILVELANAREQVNRSQSDFRLGSSRMKRRIQMNPEDSIRVLPIIQITPITVEPEQAIEYGMTLRPRLRDLEIRLRMNEMDLDNVKGQGAFRVNLEATYGREMQDPMFRELWEDPTNSYSVGLHAYVPIWDWGRRKYRIAASEISLQRTELYIEEARVEIETEIRQAVQNVTEYQQRTVSMQENLNVAKEISRQSLDRYRDGSITALDLLQSFNRQEETAENFLDAYLGYRQALLNLQNYTYFDFENDIPLFMRYQIIEDPQALSP